MSKNEDKEGFKTQKYKFIPNSCTYKIGAYKVF